LQWEKVPVAPLKILILSRSLPFPFSFDGGAERSTTWLAREGHDVCNAGTFREDELLAALMDDAGDPASPARGTLRRYEEWLAAPAVEPAVSPSPPPRMCSLPIERWQEAETW
jgi:hypothetical protein